MMTDKSIFSTDGLEKEIEQIAEDIRDELYHNNDGLEEYSEEVRKKIESIKESVKKERQRLKLEVEKVLEEFVEDHVPKDTEPIDRQINIFVIVAEELKKRLFG